MTEPPPKSVGLAALDDMIARAEAICERGRTGLAVRRLQPGLKLTASQQAIEDTLARLRKQRESVTAERERRRKGAQDLLPSTRTTRRGGEP